MKQSLLIGLLGLLALNHVLFPQTSGVAEFSKAAWLEDYQALKRFLEIGYANLDSARQAKKIDLVALDAKTRQALERASNDAEAKESLKKFLLAFEDGHLKLGEVDKPAAESQPDPPLKPSASGAEVCKSLGFRWRPNRFSLPFEGVQGFQMISTDKDVFATATLQLEGGKIFGLLRLTLFSPDPFPKVCESRWEEFRSTLKEDCDAQCRQRFYLSIQNQLTEKLTEQVKTLAAKKIAGLILDIAGNGGGTEWADMIARMLASKPLKTTLASGVRHPRDVARFERQLQLIETDLKQTNLTDEQRKFLAQAKKRVSASLAEAKTGKPCERPDIWTSPEGGKKCTSLRKTESFSSGVLDYAPRGVLNGLTAKGALFSPGLHEYQESVYTGPLFLLVDQKTASASEYFAALLQDNEAAKIIGERTMGVGCGYTHGGIKWTLPNSKLRVFMPDCIRYRKDGRNEYEGIIPDAPIWAKDDSKAMRLEKLLRTLRELR
ncbi:MAG: S41 family peptidase [Blastocatellia bacterium]